MPDSSPDDVVDESLRVVGGSPDPSTGADRRSPVAGEDSATWGQTSARTAGHGREPLPKGHSYAATPVAARDLLLIVVQLALSAILVWQFELEEKRHLLFALLAVLGGFVVNVHLPPRWRPAWFLAISVACLLVVLGWSDGLLALSVAGSLIAAASLPVAFAVRVGVLLVLAGLFTWLRSSATAPFWPIVGSMFMFRMISLMHAARKEKTPRSLAETAGYFLMLPNVFFPLFPVVDAKVFRDGWYNDEPRAIYQTGVHWIAVGLLHLVLYRLIKYEILPSPLGVHSLRDVVLYLAMNYALYLSVSGRFHLVCGMLHLFGWNLPRTHDHYFLAGSFSEIWRRINIYWKDFLMKTLFYPAFFWLRGPLAGLRSRDAVAIALAVLWVFSWTWLAHSWQMFWLNGVFPFHLADGAMWLAVGTLVASNAVLDYRRALRPRAAGRDFDWAPAAVRSLKIMGMFLIVSLFWARWTNVETFRYVLYVTTSKAPTVADVATLAAWGAAIFVALTAGHVVIGRRKQIPDRANRTIQLDRQAGWNVAGLGLVVMLTLPNGPTDYLGQAGVWLKRLQMDRLTPGEAMAVVDGYYEQLATANSQAAPFLGSDQASSRHGNVFTAMVRPRRDLLGFELIPGWRGQFDQSSLTVNRWGMRDRDRTLQKPQGVVRIAVVGNSPVMGYGVNDDETFTRQLERLLNERNSVSGRSYEVLNFGVGRYWAIHRRAQIDHIVRPFEPDVIVYVAHQDELFRTVEGLAAAVVDRTDLEDPCLDSVIAGAGVSATDPQGVVQGALTFKLTEILKCTYQHIRRSCHEANEKILFIYLPIPGTFEIPIDPKSVLPLAAESGMITSDFTGWEQDHSRAEVLAREGVDEHHPSPLGHQLIATRLAEVLKKEQLLDP